MKDLIANRRSQRLYCPCTTCPPAFTGLRTGWTREAATFLLRPETLSAAPPERGIWAAAAIVRRSLYTLDVGIKAFMAGSDFERAHKVAFAAIHKSGAKGIPESLFRRVKGISKLDQRTYGQVVEYLAMACLIRIENPKAAGRRGRRFFPAILEAE
jgi:hypothetical protein